MSASIEVILGPPGTGKTTALLNRLERELLAGTLPDRIGFFSFTRAARGEALSRVGARFNLGPDEFPWVRTIHGGAFRLLGNPDRVLDGGRWEQFAAAHGYKLTPTGRLHVEDGLSAAPRQTQDDLMRATYEWGRNRALSIDQTLARAPARVLSDAFRRFVRRYVEFKRDNQLMDFNDMLEEVLRRGVAPELDVIFVDEAQDLSPLQIRVVESWFPSCRVVFVAGDDDQAIYGFQGAEPDWLLGLTRSTVTRTTILGQSHRVPLSVHALAQRIVARNVRRVPKAYRPRAASGRVDFLPWNAALKEIDGSLSTLVLVRNRCYLRKLAEDLQQRGVAFVVEGGGAPNPLEPEIVAAARGAFAVAAGTGVGADDLRALLVQVPSRGVKILPHGAKAAAEQLAGGVSREKVQDLLRGGTYMDMVGNGGPLAPLTKLEPSTRRYLERVLARGTVCLEPKVHLTTIHGSKGREADLVVLLPDMTAATFTESLDVRRGGAEAENRVAYVGATRAKEQLIIVGARTARSYRYPRVTPATTSVSQPPAATPGP